MRQGISRAEKPSTMARLLDFPDDLITSILAHLTLRELAAMHMVNQKFNRLLSRPDPSLRPYGSVELLVDKNGKGSLPASQIVRYLSGPHFLLVLVHPRSLLLETGVSINNFPLVGRYLLKRAPGFTRVCFQSYCATDEGHQDWEAMHRFFRVSLPQLAAVFEKYRVPLEIVIFKCDVPCRTIILHCSKDA